MTHSTIAMIGAGNMGGSLIGGLLHNGYAPPSIWASDPSAEKLQNLQQLGPIHTTTDNCVAAEKADVIIFATKPALIAPVAQEIKSIVHQHHPLIISIAAGIQTNHLAHWLGESTAIVRAMPNTPALITCGATALFANTHVSEAQHNLAESILRSVGTVIWVDQEKQMDTVTALSGSGPAYFFLMMEALEEAALELGLSQENAHLLTLQTALGSARMAIESETPLPQLRKQVTSPGGTTEKAIGVLEQRLIRDIFKEALRAAKARSEELATLLGETK